MKPLRIRPHLAAIAAIGLVACGASTPPSAGGVAAPARGGPSTAVSSPAPTEAVPGAATVMEVNATGQGGAFEPTTLEIAAGTTVRFENASGNIHNVTFSDASIKSSGVMSPGEVFEVSFPRAGTFSYRCTFHPGMEGVVTVR